MRYNPLAMPIEPPEIWSVSQLTRRVKTLLESQVGEVWVSGEISNFRVSPAGHAYFTLKDAESQLDAVMFRGRMSSLQFDPENGLEVVVHGLVSVYEKRGNYQIICDDMHPKGMGALQLAFERLRKKLAEEGLFDDAHKKPIPLLPQQIGIVTSPTGAAIRDILNVIERRFANVHILLYPARVQGEEAAPELVQGIRALDAWGVDVIIVGRGGGSLEDLWPFNDERVVRAVYDANTPIISAVGHAVDFVLTDFAADLRAPTPSAAAELVVQEQESLRSAVRQLRQRLRNAVAYRLEQARRRLATARSSYLFLRPEEFVRQRRQQCDELRMRLERSALDTTATRRNRLLHACRSLVLLSPVQYVQRAADRLMAVQQRLGQSGPAIMARARARFRPAVAQLNALSPLAILARGYAVAWKLPEQELVRNAAQLVPNDRLRLQFGKGAATAAVERIEEHADG